MAEMVSQQSTEHKKIFSFTLQINIFPYPNLYRCFVLLLLLLLLLLSVTNCTPQKSNKECSNVIDQENKKVAEGSN